MHTVLLVLQSEDFRLAIQETLQEHYCVIMAHDALSGAVLLQKCPDILMLDLFLPETDGFQFLEDNHCLLPPMILLFTTFADPQILNTASDLGADAVFMKPCSISAVLKWLEAQI